jgi:hypothetical protein
MPWFAYVCESCGAHVRRQRPVAHRDLAPHHNDADGCWDGVLRRVVAVPGPRVPEPPRAREPGTEPGVVKRASGG